MSYASNLGYGNRSPFISSSHINASNVHDPAALTSRQIPEHGIFGVTSNVAAAMKGGGGRKKDRCGRESDVLGGGDRVGCGRESDVDRSGWPFSRRVG